MSRIAEWSVRHSGFAWLVLGALSLGAGWLAGEGVRDQSYQERLSLLHTEAERRGIEIMSQTLNGNVMGALGLLGTIDMELKREARGELTGRRPGERIAQIRDRQVAVSHTNEANLESIGRSYDAEGTFVVKGDGWIGSGWDNTGKPSTGLNVKFRPYYQMAMQGMENVYAAVSQARGDRMLYFSAPVFAETTSATEAIGAVVARTNLMKVDNLLRDKSDIALLLSPQEVVFASSRSDWIGTLAAQPTPERLKAIRDIKQFGDMFAAKDPQPLPVATRPGIHWHDGKRFAVARAKVQWNDPLGDWTLVMMEDLDRTVPAEKTGKLSTLTGLIVLVLGILLLRLLRGQHAQAEAARQLQALAQVQEAAAARKLLLAQATVRLQQARTQAELATAFLEETHALLGSLQGVVYVADEAGGRLELAGCYACASAPPASVRFGEGLFGQCASERKRLVITAQAGDHVTVRSGLGEATPAALVILPLLLTETLRGVVEIALLKPPGEALLNELEELSALLAMNIEIVGRHESSDKLLSATLEAERVQAEHLAFQQALVDTIPYPVFYKGPDARFLGVNRAYEETFAVRRDQLAGKRVLDLDYLPEADRIAYQAEDETVIASAGAVKREMTMPFADGKPHATLYYVSGFRRPDGSPGGLVGTFIDITALKHAEREMDRMADVERFNRLAQGREQRVLALKGEINRMAAQLGMPPPYDTAVAEPVRLQDAASPPGDPRPPAGGTAVPDLAELVDLDELQTLLGNFCESVGIASAIIDLDGKVLAAARWQRACTDFHRVNPASCARCIESDTELALKLQDGEDYTLYKCKNGMTDAAAPIVVEGRHLANVFIGQFHSQSPDLDFFREQARQFQYDEADYLQAVQAAPVIDEARLPAILSFLSGFARMISTMSLARRRADLAQKAMEAQAAVLQQERIAALSLAEDAEQARLALEAIGKEAQA